MWWVGTLKSEGNIAVRRARDRLGRECLLCAYHPSGENYLPLTGTGSFDPDKRKLSLWQSPLL
jgi:hypothetical protein